MTSSGFNKAGRHNEPIRPIFDTEIKRSTFQHSTTSPDIRQSGTNQRIISAENQYEDSNRIYNRALTEDITSNHNKMDRQSENGSRQTNHGFNPHTLPRPHHELAVKKQFSAMSEHMS
jgi:hypothetical protein